ncbi:MAG: phosphoglycerate kinase [Planctomycetaceae bacterium]|nr:phosphoglycerate kinase [Planctomycetaceae bacterium]
MRKKHIDQTVVSGKRVFIRVDFNVPMEGDRITDDRRIRASLPTIRSVLGRGGRVILASHLGRPEGKGFEAEYSLAPVARRLAELLGAEAPHGVAFPSNDCTDDAARAAVAAMPEKGVVLLDNLRFAKGEKKGDAGFAARLAEYADVYVNDAFGTSHRADASMHALPMAMRAKGAPSVIGHLLAAELEYLYGRIAAAERPFTAILGGAKVSDKILAIENLMAKVDRSIVGGAMAYTFLQAQGVATGASRVEADRVDLAREILAKAKARGCEFLLPSDHVCAAKFEAHAPTTIAVGAIPDGLMGLDIGPATREAFAAAVRASRTVVWNGPMGVFEMPPFDAGTRAVAQACVDATARGAVTIAGGGDTAAAVEELGFAGGFSHVSTGGGASLEVLEGKHLVCLDALDDA